MAFLSVLLLATLSVTLQIGKIYTKGVTNRMMNQLTRDMSDSMRRDIAAVDPGGFVPIDSSGVARDYIQLGSEDAKSGRLCLGSVTYVWNTAGLINRASGPLIKDQNNNPITFLRVVDPGGTLCIKKPDGTYTMTIAPSLNTTPLLSTEGRSITVYDMQFQEVSKYDREGLYEIRLTIGTNDQDTTTQAATGNGATTQCRPPIDSSSNFDYCAVVTLDMLIRAGGRTS